MLKDLGCRFKLGWSQKLSALRGGGCRLWSENLRAVGQDFSLCILCQTNLEQPWWFDKFLVALVPRHQPFPWQFHTEYWAVHAFDTAADHCHLGCLGYTQLHERLSAALASGELGEHWRMVERLSFSDAIQTLMTPPRTSPEDNDWWPVAPTLKQYTLFSVS